MKNERELKEILGLYLDKIVQKKKIKLTILVIIMIGFVASGGVYALHKEEREALKIIENQKKQELQLEKDKANALVAEAKAKQEMIDNADKAKDIILAKGEYSPLTVEAERQPEISLSNKGKIASWWSKNVLRIHIPYEIKYMIDMEKITPIVTEEGLFFEFGIDDFNVIVVPKGYTLMTPDSKEVGLFPKDFETEDVLALVSSNMKSVGEEFSKDEEKLGQALEETKSMILEIAKSCNSKANFVEKTTTKGASVQLDESLINNN